LTFPDFQRQMEWCRVISQKCPWKPIYRKYMYDTTHVYLPFGHFTTSAFQCDFKWKACLARYDHQ